MLFLWSQQADRISDFIRHRRSENIRPSTFLVFYGVSVNFIRKAISKISINNNKNKKINEMNIIEMNMINKDMNNKKSFKKGSNNENNKMSFLDIKKEINKKWKDIYCLEEDEESDLKIYINNREDVTNDNFKDFIEELIDILNKNKVKNIKGIKMDLEAVSGINKEGFKNLIKLMGSNVMKNVEEIYLCLFRVKEIDDNYVRDLVNIIAENMKKVKSLYIGLSWNRLISDKGLKEIGNVLEKEAFKEIERIGLDIWICKGVTDEGYKSLIDSIKENSKMIKEVKLNFMGCDEVKSSTKKVMNKIKGKK